MRLRQGIAPFLKMNWPWILGLTMVTLAVITWGKNIAWDFSHLTTYSYFPVLGLTAYSLMLSHYFVAEVRRLSPKVTVPASYFRKTEIAVLILILLHPGLLAWQLYLDHAGLPPNSYKQFVGNTAFYAILLALIALSTFLLYETKRWWRKKSWWRYIVYLNHIGMLLIFWHSLRLGFDLQSGWLKTIWYFYGFLLVLSIAHGVIDSLQRESIEEPSTVPIEP